MGRFISEDPIGLEGGINNYAYALNDPVNLSDPTGLWACPPGVVCLPPVTVRARSNGMGAAFLIDRWSGIRNGDGVTAMAGAVFATSAGWQDDRSENCPTVPEAPPGVSLHANIYEAEAYRNVPNRELWWYLTVRNGGPWDYKQGGEQYEPFGNFNYGAAGAAAGFRRETLLRAAGAAQLKAGTGQPEWGNPLGSPPYGDDPNDQANIRLGYQYYMRNCERALR